MNTDFTAQKVLICDTQPVAMEGVRWLLDNSGDLRCAGTANTLEAATQLARTVGPAAIIVDKFFGTRALMDWLQQMRSVFCVPGLLASPVLWGADFSEAEALRFLQAGARGIVRRTAPAETVLTCVRAVASGSTWMEQGIFESVDKMLLEPRRPHLTPREQQIAELVERGLRNRDIGRQLGIQTGTVKIHLKHIFEKTGVRGRYGLALTGLREKGMLALPSM